MFYRLAHETGSFSNESYIDISFSEDILVSDTHYVYPSLSVFVSELGGCLGLWLGVGIMQIAHLILDRYYDIQDYVQDHEK